MDGKFNDLLLAATIRHSKKLNLPDASRCVDLQLALLQNEVCPKCILRLLGHSTFDDYCSKAPATSNVILFLQAQQKQLQDQNSKDANPDAAHASATSTSMQHVAPGSLKRALDSAAGTGDVKESSMPPSKKHQHTTSTVSEPLNTQYHVNGAHGAGAHASDVPGAEPGQYHQHGIDKEQQLLQRQQQQRNSASMDQPTASPPPSAPLQNQAPGTQELLHPKAASSAVQAQVDIAVSSSGAGDEAETTREQAATAPCSMCLGILQLLDGTVQPPPLLIMPPAIGQQLPDSSKQTSPTTHKVDQENFQQQQQQQQDIDQDDQLAPISSLDEHKQPDEGHDVEDMDIDAQAVGTAHDLDGNTEAAGLFSNDEPCTTSRFGLQVPLSDARPEALSSAIRAADFGMFSSFHMEVLLPAALALREHSIYRQAIRHYGLQPGSTTFRFAEITPLKLVIRRMLVHVTAQQLNVPHAEPHSAELLVALQFQHDASLKELRPLLKDQLRMQQRQKAAQQRKRAKKQQRKHGQQQQQQQQQQQDVPESEEVTVLNNMLSALDYAKVHQDLSALPAHIASRLCSWPLPTLSRASSISLGIKRAPLLLAGRYCKLKRTMPQTRWTDLTTSERIGGISLHECIEQVVLPAYGASKSKFISGGREDMDVRMLGEGRPFVLEIADPRLGHPSAEALRQLEQQLKEVNNGAQVLHLQPCGKASLDNIKEAEETKEKTYRAFCWASRPLSDADVVLLTAVKDLEILQDTPIRVLHRRASKVRPKRISIEAVEPLPSQPHYFSLVLTTQAGTYIKEFCHGDFGRTQPNLGTLLEAETEILQLDVLAVHMPDWP